MMPLRSITDCLECDIAGNPIQRFLASRRWVSTGFDLRSWHLQEPINGVLDICGTKQITGYSGEQRIFKWLVKLSSSQQLMPCEISMQFLQEQRGRPALVLNEDQCSVFSADSAPYPSSLSNSKSAANGPHCLSAIMPTASRPRVSSNKRTRKPESLATSRISGA